LRETTAAAAKRQ